MQFKLIGASRYHVQLALIVIFINPFLPLLTPQQRVLQIDSMLQWVSSNKFLGLADTNILEFCPTLNLLFVLMNKTSIWVYRLLGDRIYSINNKSPILLLLFSPLGLFFSVSGLDNTVKIYDSNTGSLLNTLSGFNQVSITSWEGDVEARLEGDVNYGGDNGDVKFGLSLGSSEDKVLTDAGEDFARQLQFDGVTGDSTENLRLNQLEKNVVTTKALALSNQASKFDGLYAVDILKELPTLISFPSSLSFLTVIDSQKITFNFNNLLTLDSLDYSGTITNYVSAGFFNQVFLNSNYQLLFLKTELHLQDKNYILKVIDLICKLFGYINHVGDQFEKIDNSISPFIKNLHRFISLLADEYQESANTESFYKKYFAKYIMTGLIDPTSKDFWLNQFGDRNYKNLIKLGNACYDNTRKIVYAEIIVSLERILVVSNEFLGLATWLINSDRKFGLKLELIENLNQKVGKFLKTCYKFIWDLNKEQKLFNNFFDMAKHEFIDKLINEDDLESFLKIQADFNYSDVLKYINSSLFRSVLFDYTDFDTSEYEVFKQRIEDPDQPTIQRLFDSVESCNNAIRDSFNKFLPSIISLEVCLTLPIWEDITLTSFKSYYIVVGWKETMRLMIIDKTYRVLKEIEIKLNTPLHFVLDKCVVTLLYEDKIIQINLESVWLSDKTTFQLSDSTFSEIPTNLKTPKKIGLSDKFGCALDGNRQNYNVFKIV